MSLDIPESNNPKAEDTLPTGKIIQETAKNTFSLLRLYELDFDIVRDISDIRILEILESCYFYISNFEENGYGAIQTRNPDMGTGYAIVSGQYFEKRGSTQGIKLFKESHEVGTTSYRDETGNKIRTSIYLVGSVPSKGKSMSGALHDEDIGKACKVLMRK